MVSVPARRPGPASLPLDVEVCLESVWFTPRALVAGALAFTITACAVAPRPEVAAEPAVATAVALAVPIEFRAVGSEGVPLDEPVAEPEVLTLAQALERAVTTDPGLQAALARVRIAAAEADQARLLPNPVLAVTFLAGEGAPRLEASFSQAFVAALQRPGRACAADDRLRAAAAEAVTAALEIAREVQEHYVAVQNAAVLDPLLRE